MRHISFALTTDAFLDGSKTVTRRLGWANLRDGEMLCAVEKAQGLKKGEHVRKLGTICVANVRREPLRKMIDDPRYGEREMIAEGFPHLFDGAAFVHMFCRSHRGCTPDTIITRIEFVVL
jgi:hypothetical protein